MKEATPGRGPRRPPLFNFDGKEVVAAVDKKQVEELDPVLQKLNITHYALWTPKEVKHAQDNDGFCARVLATLQGEQIMFTRGMASRHDFEMFYISEQGVLVKAETR